MTTICVSSWAVVIFFVFDVTLTLITSCTSELDSVCLSFHCTLKMNVQLKPCSFSEKDVRRGNNKFVYWLNLWRQRSEICGYSSSLWNVHSLIYLTVVRVICLNVCFLSPSMIQPDKKELTSDSSVTTKI